MPPPPLPHAPAVLAPQPDNAPAHRLRTLPGSVAPLIVQTDWEASGRVWQLGLQADRARDSAEREALLDLLTIEQARHDLARRLLARVWGIRLDSAATGGVR
jgi:hypothetical protein